MHYSVVDFIGPISPEQRDALDRTLHEGERILWAARPKVSIWPDSSKSAFVYRMHGLVILMLIAAFACCQLLVLLPGYHHVLISVLQADGSLLRLFVLSVILFIIVIALLISLRLAFSLAASILCSARYRRNTIYILTNARAISVLPGPDGWQVDHFSLDEDMIRERRYTRAGGELIFRLEADGHTGCGWTALADRDLAEERIAAALKERSVRMCNPSSSGLPCPPDSEHSG